MIHNETEKQKMATEIKELVSLINLKIRYANDNLKFVQIKFIQNDGLGIDNSDLCVNIYETTSL